MVLPFPRESTETNFFGEDPLVLQSGPSKEQMLSDGIHGVILKWLNIHEYRNSFLELMYCKNVCYNPLMINFLFITHKIISYHACKFARN